MGYRKLGVKSAHRRAMLRNATTSLLKNGQIDTTAVSYTHLYLSRQSGGAR